MRTVIAITEYASMRGRYRATVTKGQKVSEFECGRGESSAAAMAVSLAAGNNAVIVADKKVMELIPYEFGGKA